jgi:phosphopantothenoylcysteine decarboxylase / phosphopantothenate---cysteine ligase
MLENKKILLAVCGGIAAYKAIELCSMLKKRGAQVRVIFSENAAKFVTELTFEVISHNKVCCSLWDEENAIPHIDLADWADFLVIAPATADIIAKSAHGIADDLLSSTILAAHSPVLFVPAMNIHMYQKAAMQSNVNLLKERGYLFMEPEEGVLACGYTGKGRYPANNEIIYHIIAYLQHKHNWQNKKVLITAGACQEDIDPMRFISNQSSGKMGIALARAAHILGADVTLIAASLIEQPPEYIRVIKAVSAMEMLSACRREFAESDILIMNAAVSDYRPGEVFEQKLKKGKDFSLKLIQTADIISEMVKVKNPEQLICGFAAESQNILENARYKLSSKKLDFIVANNLSVANSDVTACTFISADNEIELMGDKFAVSLQILDFIYPSLI